MQTSTAQRPISRRGEQTRVRLLDAAVGRLSRSGYAATTIESVMRASGVSRGSVLHQFPTRLDLMAAVAAHAMAQTLTKTRARAFELKDPVARLQALAEIAWEVQLEPAATAVTEILLASRWDRELAARLAPIVQEVERNMDASLLEVAREAGAPEPGEIVVPVRLMIASLRGVTIELMLNPDRQMILAALQALKADHLRLVARLLRRTDVGG